MICDIRTRITPVPEPKSPIVSIVVTARTVVSGGLHSVERRKKKRLKCDRSCLPPVVWAGLERTCLELDVPVALPRKDRLMARLGVRCIVRRED